MLLVLFVVQGVAEHVILLCVLTAGTLSLVSYTRRVLATRAAL